MAADKNRVLSLCVLHVCVTASLRSVCYWVHWVWMSLMQCVICCWPSTTPVQLSPKKASWGRWRIASALSVLHCSRCVQLQSFCFHNKTIWSFVMHFQDFLYFWWQQMLPVRCSCTISFFLFRDMFVFLSLQVIDTGCSGRLMCFQVTHSRYMSMDEEFLHTRLTQQSGGSPTVTHTSSQETGTS